MSKLYLNCNVGFKSCQIHKALKKHTARLIRELSDLSCAAAAGIKLLSPLWLHVMEQTPATLLQHVPPDKRHAILLIER